MKFLEIGQCLYYDDKLMFLFMDAGKKSSVIISVIICCML
jgi:hypothetical protein